MLTPPRAKNREITECKRTDEGLYLYSEAGLCRLMPKAPDIIRVTYTAKEEFSQEKKPGVVDGTVTQDWSYEEDTDKVIFRTQELCVEINRKTASFTYCGKAGDVLLRERKERSRELEEFEVYRLAKDGTVRREKVETADGTKEVVRAADREYAGTLYHTRLHLEWQEDELLLGLGQYEEGFFNLRGQTVYVHQGNKKIAVPLLVSSLGYGILTDTYAPMIFQDTAYGSYIYTEADREMDFYFIWGGGMEGVVKGYRRLTGKAAMLPKWAFGYLQSQERYETQEEVVSIAGEYRRRKLGLDAVILDWMSWEDGMWGQKTFDASRFPDPAAMTEALHGGNVHFMMSIWPNMSEQCENYKEFAEQGLLLPGCSIYNALDGRARALYWQQVERGIYCKGVDAWWCDSSEPYTPEWERTGKPEPAMLFAEYCQRLGDVLPPSLSDAFCLFHAQALYEGQRGSQLAEFSGKRVVNLTRSGYTGQQRYGTILWSGDISASWTTLRNQIAAGLSFCSSGLPFWTTDIGAFFVKRGDPWYWDGDYEDGSNDLGYRELYVRWYQWGGFLPVFRSHGTDCRRELWAYGGEGDIFYDALCAANRLRYELMPYIYSQAGHVWLADAMMIKPLAFSYAQDAQALGIKDQYLFGDDLMVCPVTEPMYYGRESVPLENVPKTRKVYLPRGNGWYDYRTGAYYEGGQWIEADAAIGSIPLYVREGSIIPTEECTGSTAACGKALTLRIYAGRDAVKRFYEDEGDGYGYEDGAYALTEFVWDDGKKELSVNVLKDCPDAVKRADIGQTVIIRKGE